MAVYNVHGGHNFHVPGASGCFSETVEDRKVKDRVIALLRAQGHTVYDCTDEDGTTQRQNLANIVAKCNQHSVDLDISIHFNAFNHSVHGTRVYVNDTSTYPVSRRICSKVSELGFDNGGLLNGSNLYVLKHTNAKAILVECCFCDSEIDAAIYEYSSMAKKIVEGILNKSISDDGVSPSPTPNPDNGGGSSDDHVYRIRSSWDDPKSQLAAFKSLENAKNSCPEGYNVYDWNGNVVYSNKPEPSPSDNLYRVRKSWDDEKSQLGAFKSLDNAKAACSEGYTVYDSNGNAVYSNTPSAPEADNYYRVRKSWDDVKSQLGAYSDLDNARNNCPSGYNVYDSNGNVVFSNKEDTSSDPNSKLYRVRLAWNDPKSQIGAFKDLENAKEACEVGYTVYDWDGNPVYVNTGKTEDPTPEPTPDPTPEPTPEPEPQPEPQPEPDDTPEDQRYYRVRKSWDDEKSQIGAYKTLENAKNACKYGYTVYDWKGNALYTNNTPDVKDEDIISPLYEVDENTFIEYVGTLAKADMKNTGILASVTVAQAILESGWGQTDLSLKANNLFGMKASLSGNTWSSKWDGKIYAKYTNEELPDGTIISILADFRAYDDPSKSIRDHSDYLCGAKNGSSLRYEGLKGETDYKKAIQIIKDGGYATDSKYVDKIISIIERYNLNVWDEVGSPSDIDKDQQIEDIKKDLEDTKKDLEDTKKDLDDTKKDLDDTKKDLDDTKKDVDDNKEDIKKLNTLAQALMTIFKTIFEALKNLFTSKK